MCDTATGGGGGNERVTGERHGGAQHAREGMTAESRDEGNRREMEDRSPSCMMEGRVLYFWICIIGIHREASLVVAHRLSRELSALCLACQCKSVRMEPPVSCIQSHNYPWQCIWTHSPVHVVDVAFTC